MRLCEQIRYVAIQLITCNFIKAQSHDQNPSLISSLHSPNCIPPPPCLASLAHKDHSQTPSAATHPMWGLHRPSTNKSARSSRSPTKPDLVAVHDAPSHRRPYGTSEMAYGPEGLLYAPGGPFTQPVDPGSGLSDRNHDESSGTAANDNTRVSDRVPSKKEKQWKKWDEEIIPMLLHPYIHLLHETESLRNLSTLRRSLHPSACTCVKPRLLKVACIFFESK